MISTAADKLIPPTQKPIMCMDETLILSSMRAVFRPATQTLLICDLHLGKEEVFSSTGLALPVGVTDFNLQRLNILCRMYPVRHVLILGDLMHSRPKQNDVWPHELKQWIDKHTDLRVSALVGNHDYAYRALDTRISWHTSVVIDQPFVFTHEPTVHDSGYVICGHLHPMYVLATQSDRIRCPVFWFRNNHAVLPAFGSFTGGHNITPVKRDRLYLVGDNEIIDLGITDTKKPQRGGCQLQRHQAHIDEKG